VQVDWLAAAGDALALSPRLSGDAKDKAFSFELQSRVSRRLNSYSITDGMAPLARLNELVAERFPGVASVPIPVLAPVDSARLLSERLEAGSGRNASAAYINELVATMQFLPGLSGYDAVLTISPSGFRNLGIAVDIEAQVLLAGTNLSYGSYESGEIVADQQDRYPGLRRLLGRDEVTYAFRKYGAPYFLNLECSNRTPRPKELTCAQADAIARAVLGGLRLIGGGPLPVKHGAAAPARRLVSVSPDFTYFPPGSLLLGTSEQGKGGATSGTVYGNNILFPIKLAPVFANSQVFMHGGDCLGQKQLLGKKSKDGHQLYICAQNPSKVLEELEGHSENYSYPWRDNYCESRGDGAPIECPVKVGHAGQDIRPNSCIAEVNDPERCQIDIFDVVAVADGHALWKTGMYENDLRLNMDTGNDKLYYLYLHMSTQSLKKAGMIRGTPVKVVTGQPVGKVGNFEHGTPNGTTAHLHFEVRRGDSIGDPLSPYMTLVRAYERLIGAMGTELP
jgi:Peptidase family M23